MAQPIPLPQPHELDKREKEDAMAAYLMNFAAWGAGLPLPSLNLIAAGIYYFINRKKSRFIGFYCFQAFTSQIPTTLINIGVVGIFVDYVIILNRSLPSFFVPYLIFAVLMNLLYLGVSIYSCTRAAKGRFYYFLIFGRWAYARYYGPNAISFEEVPHKNIPPGGF
ncbi:MAG: DUF4870 domain-containing protein [Deltaproteobacteria bacterium]|nr:DUF4870 domain-containing protein [Deltaproteobacteria bacterium]